MSAHEERNKALSLLGENIAYISRLYKECFLEVGRGAMLVYASDVIEGGLPTKYDYRNKKEILEFYDDPSSHLKLKSLIDDYDYKKEGIMTLITSHSNATFFITVKLK
jgi:hypothetical protein